VHPGAKDLVREALHAERQSERIAVENEPAVGALLSEPSPPDTFDADVPHRPARQSNRRKAHGDCMVDPSDRGLERSLI
jgi:hypothetical protein